jgi:glycosyltransferase involved in cell wall biosynthesis
VLYQPPNPLVVSAIENQPWHAHQRESAFKAGDICFFGRLVYEKGVDDLVRAFASLRVDDWGHDRIPPTLRIYGEGPERESIQRLAQELGVKDRVVFSGFLPGDHLVRVAREASVVVIPSRWEEPGATIAVELCMAGVAVVASARGAPGEIFQANGRVFENGSVEGLALALRDHFQSGPIYPTRKASTPWDIETIRRDAVQIVFTAAMRGYA